MDIFFDILKLALLTCIPALELRFSIPLGMLAMTHIPWPIVVLVCVIANIILGIGVFEILAPLLRTMRKFNFFEKHIWPHVVKRQEKLRPTIEKRGCWGLATFIGIPLPGTGALTGALGAFCFGFKRKAFYIANLAGVLLAAVCITLICLLIKYGALDDDSLISKLFIKQQHETPIENTQPPMP
jgi:uncharacterized membrane protein